MNKVEELKQTIISMYTIHPKDERDLKKRLDELDRGIMQRSVLPLDAIVSGTPKALEPVLAKISLLTDLGRSEWDEVVYHDGERWYSYGTSKTFQNGEQVTKWRYTKECY